MFCKIRSYEDTKGWLGPMTNHEVLQISSEVLTDICKVMSNKVGYDVQSCTIGVAQRVKENIFLLFVVQQCSN